MSVFCYRNWYFNIQVLCTVKLNDLSFCPVSGILKQVKDHIKQCVQCQTKRIADDGSRLFSQPKRAKGGVVINDEEEEEEEDDEDKDESLFGLETSSHQKSNMSKHELVFVSIGFVVIM